MRPSQSIILMPPQSIVPAVDYLSIGMLVIDRSGSMQDFEEAPLQKTNEFLEKMEQDSNADVIAVAVVTFADTLRVDIPLTMILKKPRLPFFKPEGNTALYETGFQCLGGLILLTDARANKGAKTDVTITFLSDGWDSYYMGNAVHSGLHAVAAEGRRRNWNMRVHGFGVDGSEIAQRMGFSDRGHATTASPQQRSVTFDATREGMEQSTLINVNDLSRTTQVGRSKIF